MTLELSSHDDVSSMCSASVRNCELEAQEQEQLPSESGTDIYESSLDLSVDLELETSSADPIDGTETIVIEELDKKLEQEEKCINNNNKYVVKQNVLTVMFSAVVLLTLNTYISTILAIVYLAQYQYLWFVITILVTIVPTGFTTLVSRIWKYSHKYKNKSHIIRHVFMTVITTLLNTELQFYYEDCNRYNRSLQKAKEENNVDHQEIVYKLVIQVIDDVRYLVILGAVTQCVPNIISIIIYLCMYHASNYFILFIQILILVTALASIIVGIIAYKILDYSNEFTKKYHVTTFGIFITIFSLVLYILDVISDLILAIQYVATSQYLYFSLTLTFVILPGIYITWYNNNRNKTKIKFSGLSIVKTIVNLAPVCGYSKSIRLLKKTRKAEIRNDIDLQKNSFRNLLKNNFDVAISRYYESFTEATSQLILQMSTIDFVHFNQKLQWADIFKFMSIATSWISLAISLVLFFRSKRIHRHVDNTNTEEVDPLNLSIMIVQFLGYFPILVPRVVSISFVASIYPLYTFVGFALNWIIIIIWMRPKCTISAFVIAVVQSLIYTYTPPINTELIEMIFHTIYLTQNLVAIVFWAISNQIDILLPVLAITVPTLIGVVFRFMYRRLYNCFIKYG